MKSLVEREYRTNIANCEYSQWYDDGNNKTSCSYQTIDGDCKTCCSNVHWGWLLRFGGDKKQYQTAAATWDAFDIVVVVVVVKVVVVVVVWLLPRGALLLAHDKPVTQYLVQSCSISSRKIEKRSDSFHWAIIFLGIRVMSSGSLMCGLDVNKNPLGVLINLSNITGTFH